MISPREVLILEPDAEGHAQEWLQHLAEFVAADPTVAAISVVAPAALCTALSRSMPVVPDGRIRFIALTPRELKLCTYSSLSVAAFARWWTMPEISRAHRRRLRILSFHRSSLSALGAWAARGGQTDRRRPVRPLGALPRSRKIPAEFGRTPARLAKGPALSPDVAKSERPEWCCRSIRSFPGMPMYRITTTA